MEKDHEPELLRDIEEIARMEELLAKARDISRKHEEQLRQVLSEPTSQAEMPQPAEPATAEATRAEAVTAEAVTTGPITAEAAGAEATAAEATEG